MVVFSFSAVVVTCPPIQTWESMLSNTSVYVYNTYVNVSCEEGLVLDTWQDWSIVWCDENGAWIPTPPQCTGKFVPKSGVHHIIVTMCLTINCN